MIRNERQYRITKSQVEKFELALRQLDETENSETHPLLRKAQEDAVRSQLADLRAELEEYEALKSGRFAVPELASVEELPRSLIRARIAAGLSQKELAIRLGLKEQQIQQYEATEYASASLSRVKEVIQALGISVSTQVLDAGSKVSLNTILKRLNQTGLDSDFVIAKLIPRKLVARLQEQEEAQNGGSDNLTLQVASIIGRIFNIDVADFFGRSKLQLDPAATGAPMFKVAARAEERRLIAYTIYAHYLALLLLEATVDLPRQEIPTNPAQVRDAILSAYGSLTLESSIRYVWSLGVPVLPLNDSSAFYGACWRTSWRNVIALKQNTKSEARWMNDLYHEVCHASGNPDQEHFSIIEASETAKERRTSPEEQAASEFAGDVILGGRAEELAMMCVEAANGKVEWLKGAVPRVARREGVRVDALANYMAFRLSMDGINWWPTASVLQEENARPWQTARDILLEHVDFSRLNEVDRSLLQQALAGVEG
jgi:transcriptional regulator with XRE-family HTH domain